MIISLFFCKKTVSRLAMLKNIGEMDKTFTHNRNSETLVMT